MDVNNIELQENVDELLHFQKELKEEEEMLSEMLFKIEKQIHALQIEKMHLINLMTKNSGNVINSTQEETVSRNSVPQPEKQNVDESNLDIDLNLNMSSVYKYCMEEDDSVEEEEEDNVEEDEDYDDYI